MAADLSAFGSEVAEKYKQALTSKRLPKLEMTSEVKNEIIAKIKAQMAAKPDQPYTQYLTDRSGINRIYDVMVIETPSNLEIRPYKFGPGARVKWNGESMTLFLEEKLVDSLEPDCAYVVVGKYRLAPGKGQHQGRQFNNFNVQEIITMADVEAHKGVVKDEEKEQAEIKENVEEHKIPVEKDVTPKPIE